MRIRSTALTLLLAGLLGCGGPVEPPTTAAGLEQALAALRPDSPANLRGRACLKWRLGRTESARREAVLALLVDPGSASGCRQAGALELALGQPGAALSMLERAHKKGRKDKVVRAALAALLLTRAEQRMDPVAGLLQLGQAEADLRRAVTLDPELRARACALRARLERLKRTALDPDGWARLRAQGGEPFRGNVACPGPPRGLGADLGPLIKKPRCGLDNPRSYLPRLKRRYLLMGCAGAQLGLRLERWGCLEPALEVWQALADEAPADPRWPLQAARAHLARGEPERAEPLLTSHVFLSRDRAAAMLATARVQLQAGQKTRAARRAARAAELALTLEGGRAAVALMEQAGHIKEAALVRARLSSKKWRELGTPPR